MGSYVRRDDGTTKNAPVSRGVFVSVKISAES
jgi:hypothetical protein